MTHQSVGSRVARSFARSWADMSYAQRRLFEIQTGLRITDRRGHEIVRPS